jgi:hypothetical protein
VNGVEYAVPVEHSVDERCPFPREWGTPPAEVERRSAWAVANIRRERRAAMLRRLVDLVAEAPV